MGNGTGSPFTEIEAETVRMVWYGLTNRQIAYAPRIPLGTVNGRIYRARQKIGASNRLELARHLWKIEGHASARTGGGGTVAARSGIAPGGIPDDGPGLGEREAANRAAADGADREAVRGRGWTWG